MPPNASSTNGSIANEVRKRPVSKTNLSRQIDDQKSIANENTKSTKASPKTTKKYGTCVRVSAIFTGLFTFAVFAFLFIPWESYFFTDEELQNYLDLLEDGQEGDWVMRQFLATVDQNFTEPKWVVVMKNFS